MTHGNLSRKSRPGALPDTGRRLCNSFIDQAIKQRQSAVLMMTSLEGFRGFIEVPL
jgi:hypothetical protein